MAEYLLVGIASIIILGIGAQWLAWRLRLPSILVLLVVGFIAGPVTGFLNPDELLGDTLFPIVSLSVALILFEGGLSLKFAEVRQTGRIVRNLVTVGALVTWVLATAAAYLLLELELPLALLFGAILVVTGPTVIIPLLRHVRAVGRISSIIKWEGILNDPIGAVLAVLIFEAIAISGLQNTVITVVTALVQTLLIGFSLGALGAGVLTFALKRYWVPDSLQNGVILMVVLGVFVASNIVQEEAGLFTVTLMGILLANQKAFDIRHIIEFKENLVVILLSNLFIILAARLQLTDLAHLGPRSLLFLLALIVIVRPAAVFLSTVGTGLGWSEKLFLSWMAPRGIVAAAVTAVFALELAEHAGYTKAEIMVPEMFLVIVGTVLIYGLSAGPLGRRLELARPNPQGILIVGAHAWARDIGLALQTAGYHVLLVDRNRANIRATRMAGLPTLHGDILSETILGEIEMGRIGRFLGLTANNAVNALASLHLTELFGQANVYQLPPPENKGQAERESLPFRGRYLFAPDAYYAHLDHHFETGGVIKSTQLSNEFKYNDFLEYYNHKVIPLFIIDEQGNLSVVTTDYQRTPLPGHTIIALVQAV